jgi:hypothetical protein
VTSVSGGTPARTQGGAEKQPADINCTPTGFAAAAVDTGGGAAAAVDTGVRLPVPAVTPADVAAVMMGLSGQPVVPAPSPSLDQQLQTGVLQTAWRDGSGRWRAVSAEQWKMIERVVGGPLGLVQTAEDKSVRFAAYLDGTPQLQGKAKVKKPKPPKPDIRKLLAEHSDLGSSELARQLRKLPGMSHVTASTVRQWRRHKKPKRPSGKPVCVPFERAVLDELVYTDRDGAVVQPYTAGLKVGQLTPTVE